MKGLFKELNNQKLSLLFSIILTYWAMSSFFGFPILDILLVISLVNTILFAGYIYAKKQGFLGGILFVLGSVAYGGIVLATVLSSGKSNLYYLIWIVVTKPESIEVIPAFSFATLLIASYGFSSTVFYFTNIKYRISVLLLIGIIPFMLQSAKTDSNVTIPFILFLILFFSLYAERTVKRTVDSEKDYHINNPWYLASLFLFIGIVMTLALISPKPATIPKIAYINQVLNQTIQNLAQTNQQNIQIQDLSNIFSTMGIKNQSTLDSMTPPLGDNVLFEVQADEPLYFRVQNWDMYDDNRWLKGNKKLDEKRDVRETKNRYYKFNVLIELMQRMKENGLMVPGISETDTYFEGTLKPQEVKQAYIYTRGVPMQSLLNPPGICDFGLWSGSMVYINDFTECYFADGHMPNLNESYTVEYLPQNVPQSKLESGVLKKINKELVTTIFNTDNYVVDYNSDGTLVEEVAEGKLIITPQTKDVIEDANYEMNTAFGNYTDLPNDLPQRIYDLADSITAGLTNDYDKAEAIVNFFYTTGFEYDLTPPRKPVGMDYIDFFIFESKQGICMHFASAMVVLARAAGIPARYVEGFIANEWDPESGRYLIREKHAHAFPEVYIAGFGWMVFEPTVSIGSSNNGFNAFFEGLINTFSSIVSAIGNFIAIMPLWAKLLFIPYTVFVLFILLWLFNRIRRSMWRNLVLSSDNKRAVALVFERISYLLGKINLDIKKYETPLSYAERVLEASGINLLEFAESFNESEYGGLTPNQQVVSASMEKYNEVRIHVKKEVGKLKAWMV
ncbi:MAG: Protein-glutamine gamma-glutamyltransferase [Firmicutes bacterium ADurb.Bin419]|nr:MAG: Protein-glutamine gamma-glutamyltransferase [Firmicutes bacterium ADurb.Bin419]